MFENFISKDGSVFEMSKISSGYKCPGHTYNLQWEYTNWETFYARNVLRLNFCKSLSLKQHPLKGIVSQNVIYTNPKNILKADVIEINIKTKDTKISMYEGNSKVNIRSID